MSNNQIDPTSGLAINCRNCIHCERSPYGAMFDTCMKSGGGFCNQVHNNPKFYTHICNNYSSWTPRKKTIPELISDKIRKMLTDT